MKGQNNQGSQGKDQPSTEDKKTRPGSNNKKSKKEEEANNERAGGKGAPPAPAAAAAPNRQEKSIDNSKTSDSERVGTTLNTSNLSNSMSFSVSDFDVQDADTELSDPSNTPRGKKVKRPLIPR